MTTKNTLIAACAATVMFFAGTASMAQNAPTNPDHTLDAIFQVRAECRADSEERLSGFEATLPADRFGVYTILEEDGTEQEVTRDQMLEAMTDVCFMQELGIEVYDPDDSSASELPEDLVQEIDQT